MVEAARPSAEAIPSILPHRMGDSMQPRAGVFVLLMAAVALCGCTTAATPGPGAAASSIEGSGVAPAPSATRLSVSTPTGAPLSAALARAPHFLLFVGG